MNPYRLVAVAVLAAGILVGAYVGAGGGTYTPTPVADPCLPREWRSPDDLEASAEQFTLSALDGAACELGVTREELAAALASDSARERFAAEHGVDDAELEAAVRAGLVRAVDDAEEAGALNGIVADGLRAVAERIPVDEGIDLIENAQSVFEDGQGLLDQFGGLLDSAGSLLP